MRISYVLFISVLYTSQVLAQSPGNVPSNLKLWLKADAGITGATPVSAWADQSGNGYNATVPTSGPDLVSNQINFNPSLNFVSGSKEYLQVTNGIFGASTFNDAWVYTVSRTDNDATTNTIFNENLLGSNQNFDLLLTWSNANTYYDFGDRGGAGRLNGAWGGTNGVYNVWTHGTSTTTSTPNGTRKAIARDGAVILANDNNDNATGNNQNFTIGGQYTGIDNYYLDGQIAELIVYTGVPSLLEQEKIQSYLSLKYGITKNSLDNVDASQDERDYFASDASVIWDYSANSAYANDIAGIGRDDNSALDQQQSKSINPGTDCDHR
jgi:hypothetical protein